MHFRPAGLVLLAVAAVALGACARTETARDRALVAVRIENLRAHLLASAENAAAGRWELAAVHAGHPAEDLQPIDAALSKIDPQADATLRARIAAVRDAVAARDPSLAATIADADRLLEDAEQRIAGDAAGTP